MWDFDQDSRIFFMSLADKNIFISSFPICGLFISFSCLITLARVSRMILKSVAGGTILALFMIFVGKLLIVFSLEDDICRFFCKCSLSSWINFLLLIVDWEVLFVFLVFLNHEQVLSFCQMPSSFLFLFCLFLILALWWAKVIFFKCLFYVPEYFCLKAYVHQCVCLVLSEGRDIRSPGTAFQMAVNHHVTAGNRTQVQCKNGKSS